MSHEDGRMPGLFSHESVAPEVYPAADSPAAHSFPVFSAQEGYGGRGLDSDG